MDQEIKEFAERITEDERVKVDAETWYYGRSNYGAFTQHQLNGQVDIVLLNVPHRLYFNLSAFVMNDGISNGIVDLKYSIATNSGLVYETAMCKLSEPGVTTYSHRTFPHIMHWLINDAIIAALNTSDELLDLEARRTAPVDQPQDVQ